VSNFTIGKIGDTIRLQGISAQRLFVGDVWLTQGYIVSGQPREVTISAVHDCFILDLNCNQWKLEPEHGNDFYVVIPKQMQSDSITISRDKYNILQAESQFLSALQSAGVDNWDGYALAKSDKHDDDDDPEDPSNE
jgi:hypothetical protein